MTDIAALLARLPGLPIETNPALVRQKSRDFFWYSPVLKARLDHLTADAVVAPRTREEVAATLQACFELGIPVTPRGAGTGNYGQAMPLARGVVLDLSGMNRVLAIAPGRVRAEAGAVLRDIDRACQAHSGQELRLLPSTAAQATLGGFVAGGSGGVGSISWGGLRDAGNILSLTILTMEASPRVLTLQGEEIHAASHAYGTTGIIVEAEMPLAPAYDWVDVIVGLPTLAAATAFANALGEQDGLLKKQLAVIAAPVPHDSFPRHRAYLPREAHVVVAMLAPHAMGGFHAFLRGQRGATLLFSTEGMSPEERRGLPVAYELGWNHTTLRALKVDPAITYLQTLYPFPNQLDLVARVHAEFGDELPAHLEFVRLDGKITCFGLPLVRYTTEQRLDAIVARHEALGIPVFNPHRYTLEEGGMKRTDPLQLAFKRGTDPAGLLNPGKMIAWDDPAYDFGAPGTYLFPGLARA